jgi:hypothetical protein
VPLPAVCLQLVTLTQVSWHDAAALQFCWVEAALFAVSWQLPVAQFCTHVAPVLHDTSQLLAPVQCVVHVEPEQFTWQSPVAGQFMVQLPEVQLHC